MTPLFSRTTDGCILSSHSHSYTNITPERTVAGLVEWDPRECEWSSVSVFRGQHPVSSQLLFVLHIKGQDILRVRKNTHKKKQKKKTIDPRPRRRSWPFYTQ